MATESFPSGAPGRPGRRADVRSASEPAPHGIDHVRIAPDDPKALLVTFLRAVPDELLRGVPDGRGPLSGGAAVITGGTRITGIRVTAVTRIADRPRVLRLALSARGDRSVYTLRLRARGIDPVLGTVSFRFTDDCEADADCGGAGPGRAEDPSPAAAAPLLDYLARDYAGLRRMFTELLAARAPGLDAEHPASPVAVLVEALALAGDHLAYQQDAVATEAYLDTARLRRSLRRHALLLDHRVHEGRNAWLAAVLTVDSSTPPAAGAVLPRGTRLLTALPGRPVVLSAQDVAPAELLRDPELRAAVVFETTRPLTCRSVNNVLQLHTWGEAHATLPAGAREAHLYAVATRSGTPSAELPLLGAGDWLILEEIRGTDGPGSPPDPARRALVRLEGEPQATTDPLYARQLAPATGGGPPQPRLLTAADTEPLPLLRVRWRREDAPALPLRIAAVDPRGGRHTGLTVAWGNVVPADHGLTVSCEVTPVADAGAGPVELRLPYAPLTWQAPGDEADPFAPRDDPAGPADRAVPAVALLADGPDGGRFLPVPDLLDSTPYDRHLVVEPATGAGPAVPLNTGPAGAGAGTPRQSCALRLGDGRYGADPASDGGPVHYLATLRVGNGMDGMAAADSLAHVAPPAPLPRSEIPPPVTETLPLVLEVRNPLAARGAVLPEPDERVRRHAPQGFRTGLRRAVTEADYAEAVRELPQVQGAFAVFRWTGSWRTVVVSVDPADAEDLLPGSGAAVRLAPAFEAAVRARLDRVRQAGVDVRVRAPAQVPLDLALTLCPAPGHSPSRVAAAVRRTLGTGPLPDGGTGFFDPARWSFGMPVRLSALYAALAGVPGVGSVRFTRFRRYARPAAGELDSGVIPIDPHEIARCDHDLGVAERGRLRVTWGGRA